MFRERQPRTLGGWGGALVVGQMLNPRLRIRIRIFLPQI